MTKSFGQKLRQLISKPQVAHVCQMCGWFRPNKSGGNRYCKYPGKLNVEGSLCLCWLMEPNQNKRVYSLIDVSEPLRTTA